MLGDERVQHVVADSGHLLSALSGAVAVIDASMAVRLDGELISAAPSLRVISCATTGSDHIDRHATRDRGIAVLTLREDQDLLRGLTPAAELTWGLVLALARRLAPALRAAGRGEWKREDFPGVMLRGKCLGLVGCGRIGQWMARYASAFGMEVIGYDPHLEQWPEEITSVSLETVASQADFVSLHVHLTDSTKGMIDAAFIKAMKPDAFVVNTSRSGIWDEAALLAALHEGRLAGAAADVVSGEPEVDGHPLIQYAASHDNLLITPHIGGFSPEAVGMVCERAANKVIPYLDA